MAEKMKEKLHQQELKNPGAENRRLRKKRLSARRGTYVNETRPTRVIGDKRRNMRRKAAEKEIKDFG